MELFSVRCETFVIVKKNTKYKHWTSFTSFGIKSFKLISLVKRYFAFLISNTPNKYTSIIMGIDKYRRFNSV